VRRKRRPRKGGCPHHLDNDLGAEQELRDTRQCGDTGVVALRSGTASMTMSPGLRKLALATHLTLSVGWIGAVAAYMALDAAAATSEDAQILRAAYIGMELIARKVIVPVAFASLLTGIVMSLGTKWGLFRHYWVLISFLMTIIAVAVLMVETQTISYLAAMAADPTTSDADLRRLGNTLVHSVGAAVVLVVILVLNLYKPRGLTGYGWRKQLSTPQRNSKTSS